MRSFCIGQAWRAAWVLGVWAALLACYGVAWGFSGVAGRLARRAARDERGAGLVEYILIILVIAVLAVAFLTVFRGDISNAFGRAGKCISGNVNNGSC